MTSSVCDERTTRYMFDVMWLSISRKQARKNNIYSSVYRTLSNIT